MTGESSRFNQSKSQTPRKNFVPQIQKKEKTSFQAVVKYLFLYYSLHSTSRNTTACHFHPPEALGNGMSTARYGRSHGMNSRQNCPTHEQNHHGYSRHGTHGTVVGIGPREFPSGTNTIIYFISFFYGVSNFLESTRKNSKSISH